MLKYRNSNNELYYWQNNDSTQADDDDDEQSSTSLSVSLLLKHRFGGKLLSTCSSSNSICSCHRSFHLFCTDLLVSEPSSTMINIHPAPRHHDRNARRLLLSSARKRKSRLKEEADQEAIMTSTRSDPCQLTMVDSQSLEKKLPIPLRVTNRTTSLNVPNPVSSTANASLPFYRAFPLPAKPPPVSINRNIKPSKSFSQLQIRAQSVFDHSSVFFPNYLPRGPPPSPKTPTQDLSFIIQPSMNANPFRAMSILPRTRYSTNRESAESRSQLVRTANYEDHAREYLSASDCSDGDDDIDQQNGSTKEKIDKEKSRRKSQIPSRVRSLSRSDTTTRDRLLLQHPNQYLSLAEVYYSSLDMYKNLSKRSRPHTRAAGQMNDNEETATNGTGTSKGNTAVAASTTSTAKTSASPPQVKSVFGFSKTASSMHFGHAAGRLGLQSSFEKWPQPASRRTPMERKQEVTTLRLVTLPLVTS